MSGWSLAAHPSHRSSSFREDAPRPPVPGEEWQTPCQLPPRSQGTKSTALTANPKRNEDGLGEPEGSASPDSPLVRWTKSLHCLLADQDGAHLFRTFLDRERCVDTLDFWFACNGFRQMDITDAKTLRVAKAIHKRYVDHHSVVSKQLKPPTKVYLRDSIRRQQIESSMFDRAQSEIQALLEDSAYHVFLASDIYLEYVRTGGENLAYLSRSGAGNLKVVSGYLPTLNEEEEWNRVDLKHKNVASVLGLAAISRKASASWRAAETVDGGCRVYKKSDPASPYHVTSGYAFAPATSANESEVSSDAMTDDSVSVTESSVDGIPPYRTGSKKQLQREMQRSIKANGQVSLPHFPRTFRLPREMTPVEPAAFAAELIGRLEKVKREQDALRSLEARLQLIKEEEEKEELETPTSCQPGRETSVLPRKPLLVVPSGSCEDDPQAILDNHLSRVLQTPGCQSPGMGKQTPCARSPDLPRPQRPSLPPVATVNPCAKLSKDFITKQTTKHIHHHYIHHHHSLSRATEEIEEEAARRVQCYCDGSVGYCCKSRSHSLWHMESTSSRAGSLSRRSCKMAAECPGDLGATSVIYHLAGEDPPHTSWQQIVERESERQSRHRQHSKKAVGCEQNRAASVERPTRHHQWGAVNGQPRNMQLSHPADPPSATSPSTLAQLEEACRRLTEASKHPKPRCPAQARSHSVPCQPGSGFLTPTGPVSEDPKEAQKFPPAGGELMVTYFYCGEEIPYRRTLKSHSLTLGNFKEQLSKKGKYRYYFKKASREFECGAVFEEIQEDDAILPTYEGRVLGKVERID
ncbi:axin-2 [Spea bombifrons]|uniref:axin-2 n=1 Tax=Spea bombifrons TaxID=233779 RepID=UPI002349008B|nr:axin-2 [Spea bombifrons]